MNWEKVPYSMLSDAQFLLWQALLEERTGMYVPLERKSLLQSNLIIRMREIGCTNYDQYYAQILPKPSGLLEWSILLDRLMVQETRFYRNSESLQLVKRFLERGRAKRSPVNIWSVGCCTGEEPYTLAMLAHESLGDGESGAAFGISATDISLPALHKAREGIYNGRKLVDLDPSWVEKYFRKVDGSNYQVADELKRRVCFSMANMVEIDKSPLRHMDVIYCQNVLIYFRKERRHEILDCLIERLAPGGMLVIGQGEATNWTHPWVARVPDNQTLAYLRHTDS